MQIIYYCGNIMYIGMLIFHR